MSTIVFTFNIRQSVYNNVGLKPFIHIKNNHRIHLLPIVTSLTDSI